MGHNGVFKNQTHFPKFICLHLHICLDLSKNVLNKKKKIFTSFYENCHTNFHVENQKPNSIFKSFSFSFLFLPRSVKNVLKKESKTFCLRFSWELPCNPILIWIIQNSFSSSFSQFFSSLSSFLTSAFVPIFIRQIVK